MLKRSIRTLGFCTLVGLSPAVVSAGQTTASDVKEEALDAAGTLKDYAVDKKDQAVDQANRLVSKLDQRIDKLQAEVGAATGSAKQQMQASLDSLKRKRDALGARVNEMTASSSDAWSHTKQGFIDAFDELQSAYEKAKAEFNS